MLSARDFPVFHKGWSLFLDRDGVLNHRPCDGYVKRPGDFHWTPGSLESLNRLNKLFNHIVVISNQQGVGKGLMSDEDLQRIHERLLEDVEKAEARIDRIYTATGLRHGDSHRRKPGEGMAMEARHDFTDIRFEQTIMAGDTFRDMLFGKRLGMITVLIAPVRPFPPQYHYYADFHFVSLQDFTNFMITYFNT